MKNDKVQMSNQASVTKYQHRFGFLALGIHLPRPKRFRVCDTGG